MTAFAGAAHFALLSALLLLGGTVTVYWLVLRHRSAPPAFQHAASQLARLAVGLLIVGLVLNMAAQFSEFRDPLAPTSSEMALLLQTGWGSVWKTQLVLATMCLICSTLLRRKHSAWIVLTVAAIALCASPSFASHAMATEHWQFLAVAADVAHVLAGSAWIGGMITLAWLLGRPNAWLIPNAGAQSLGLVRRFSPIALTAAAVIVSTGTLSSWLRLTAVHDLWTSGYGRLLTIKIVFFLGVLAGGWYNWRRATPRLERSGNVQALRNSLRIEIAFALLLLATTAFLIATPPPGE